VAQTKNILSEETSRHGELDSHHFYPVETPLDNFEMPTIKETKV
jgi:hypothetical protein